MATSDPVHNPELFCEVWPREEESRRSDMTEVDKSGEDVTQDENLVRLGASTTGVDFDAYVSVDQELVMCGMLCMEEMCGVVWWEVEVVWRRGKVMVMTMKPSFMEALSAFESMRAFMYAHYSTIRDQVNINIERLLFSLKRKGATKQMRINDFC
jgi:hypothetical protein